MTLAFQCVLKAAMLMVVIAKKDTTSHMQRSDGETNLWTSVNGRFTRVPGTEPQKGTVGMTWQVTDSMGPPGEIRILKILIYKENKERDATYKMLSIKSAEQYDLAYKVREGKRECEVQQYLAKEGAKAQNHIRKGARRLVACYDTNIPSKDQWSLDSEEPLWILMESGGESTLYDWIHHPKWNVELAKMLFKQLVEGLNFLGSITTPYIHHDLKPENIAIKEKGHELLVKIIDFGAAAAISEKNRFEGFLDYTDGFCPWECDSKAVQCVSEPDVWKQWFDMCESDNCGPACGLAYDVFSAGQIWINMILGEPSDTWGYSVEHTTDITLEKVLGNFTIRNEKQQKYPDFQEKYDFDKFGAVLVELQKDSFFEDIKSTINAMLKYNASERITTQQLLNRRWMVQIDTPDEEYLGQIPPAGEGSDFESGQHFV